LKSIENGKLDVYKGKVYEPVADIKLVMSNLLSEYLATAYDIRGAKKVKPKPIDELTREASQLGLRLVPKE